MVRPRIEVEIARTFQGPRVLTVEQLIAKLGCSRATVFRRLSEHGYYSSYNQAGKFLTIDEVAEFDAMGLWLWRAARFSREGSLKDTVLRFIEKSERGMTCEELSTTLGVRVQNTLLQLVREKKTDRERLGATFVYLSEKDRLRRQQARRRIKFLEEGHKPVPTSQQVVSTLLVLIEDPRATRDHVVCRCQGSGVAISPSVVDAIFETYDLDKKRALSRSSTSSGRNRRGPRLR
jgi:hypothetical protein